MIDAVAKAPLQAPARKPIQRFYSAKTRGFYSSDLHTRIPSDAVVITDAEWTALLAAQSAGKEIMPDAQGRPIAGERPVTPQQRRALLQWQLDQLDSKSIRAIREERLNIPAPQGQPSAEQRLLSYEQQAVELRKQLKALA